MKASWQPQNYDQAWERMVASGKDPDAVAAERGFETMESGELATTVDQLIAAHPDEWQQFVDGDEKKRGKLVGFFVGHVMRATQGQADGKVVTALLNAKRG